MNLPSRSLHTSIVLLLVGCALAPSEGDLPLVEERSPFDGKLPPDWRGSPSGELCAAWIVMRRQVDLDALGRGLRASDRSKGERRRAVLDALESLARSRQEEIDQALQAAPGVEEVRGLTVVNGLILRATREVVASVARRADVAYVVEERRSERGVWGGPPSAGEVGEEAWWLAEMGVPEARKSGLDGEGVVIGVIDSGASAGHEQTEGGFRGGADSWYDPAGEAVRPVETHPTSHGTSVISLAVGRKEGGPMAGVAPGARWVAALGFPEGRFANLDLVLCADWMLRRGQPDVLIAAWEIPGSPVDPTFDRVVSAFKAAGTFVLFAAGNHGPGSGTNHSPANAVGIYPGDGTVFSVGGTGRGGKRLPETSEGPNVRDPSRIFPTVSAPGDELLGAHALAADLYVRQRGTSFSVALAAGAAALLLQADPALTVDDLEACLVATALDLGETGPDNVFGHGLIRVDRALTWLEERSR